MTPPTRKGTPVTIIPDRLQLLPTLHLDPKAHRTFQEGHCFMEVAAWLAGEPHSDNPSCVSPVLRKLTIGLNDAWDDEQRQLLLPFLPRVVGTAGDGRDEARSYLALDWLIRVYTPAWLELAGLSDEAGRLRGLHRITDRVTASAAGPVVRDAKSSAAAARDAARAAAWDAARAAAQDAARGAARDAAGDALRPTVTALQASALDLLEAMIDPADPKVSR
jgi:hypothetical protein